MTDLTRIFAPFALLDEAYGPGTAEALKEHGGPYQRWHGTSLGWQDVAVPSWYGDCIYRVKPQPRECWVVYVPDYEDPWCAAWPTEEEAQKRAVLYNPPAQVLHMREVQ